MKLTFMGATGTVTGSKYLLEINNKKILVDCGLFQGYKELRLRNWAPLPVSPQSIDALLLTHAHIDHSGYIPLLVKNGFKGPIYATEATYDLCSILLPDSGYIHEEDARRANKYGYTKHTPALPLYTKKDAEMALKQFEVIEYETRYSLVPDGNVSWKPAGHILGSSFIHFYVKGVKTLFTGDMGRTHDPVMQPPAIIEALDYLIIESTYGNRLHEKENPKDIIANIVNKTAKRGGTILIPAFAVGRTQNILYYLSQLKKENRIPDLPIFLDSPMAINVTDLLYKHPNEHHLSQEECYETCNIATYTNTVEESKSIDKQVMPKIIISASGMATGGRILHHLKVFAPDHRNTILLTGFQAAGTRGDRLLKGERKIKLLGQMISINAEVENLTNISAHADYEEMLVWLKQLKRPPKKVFLTHGEPDAIKSFAKFIKTELNWNCMVPNYLDKVELK
ncbi:MBL fold metallo-hydrolase [Legionella yabuuchiae]|uniref:MBL fold metallo-hydrolase n=1 Tax=Legionella yabuuchiae TaxID=376727 RepID=UPI0010545FB5|nr:MBL fold metallo-hydrolase [Legionella yabuuchiae]